ncbi:MAG: imidazole glycerol phosphate synthase subunit HisH [Bryobacteraceae bacterium]
MIAIYDYGAGNLRSVANTLEAIGAPYRIVRDVERLRRAGKIILPGVGHYGQLLRALDTAGAREALLEAIRQGVPYLGICLGLQALFQGSEEAPGVRGLGLLAGRVARFPAGARVPHMGWNRVNLLRSSRLLEGIAPGSYFYFAHSYYAPLTEATVATATYHADYTAVLETENIFGVQFHPEKSGGLGLAVMRNFVEL